MNEWNIGLAAWIIQDGNYPDFERGQRAEFAVMFEPTTITYTQQTWEKRAEHLGDARYKVVGEVTHVTDELWVLDFGISAFCTEERPSWVKPGVFAVADVNLDIDYYVYFEALSELADSPALIYSWHVDSICILPAANANKKDVRTPMEVAKTDAWRDNDGNAEYILRCTKLDDPPKYTSQTAT